MKITILAVGKVSLSFLKDGIEEYKKRMRSYANVTITEVKEEKVSDRPDEAERLRTVEAEGERLLKQIKDGQFVFLLDLHGETMSSEKLAAKIASLGLSGRSDIVFVIGGAYGVSDALRKRADIKLSFSPMTFTHQMVRLLIIEQIYRTFKINRKEPYHW